MTSTRTQALVLAALLALPTSALAETFKGMILSRDGSALVVKGPAGDVPVSVTPATKVRGISGALSLQKEDRPQSDLIRGLAVEVSGERAGDQFIAETVEFKTSDLKTAKQIAAGLHDAEARVADAEGRLADAEDRIDNVAELVPAGRTKVFFKLGSAVVSEEGKRELQTIAAQAKAIKGYRLAVVGRADPTGNVQANQRLSEARAAAVTAYLLQACGVTPGRILPTAALGDAPIAQDPDPPKSDAEARRVTVTIAVSKSSRASR
jgi:outer membrane protein OmpA-like peptidoglycan-associated protein